MTISFSQKQATCNNAMNMREILKNPSLNTAQIIIAREAMPVDTVKDMFNGCRKLMSREGKLKGEDLYSLK